MSEPGAPCEASQFQAEPVEGRRVSKVVKTTVVRGERVEKHLGDPRLASDLPSAKEDFEQVSSSVRRVRRRGFSGWAHSAAHPRGGFLRSQPGGGAVSQSHRCSWRRLKSC